MREAPQERGIPVGWVIGTSIGAINGALIAGNRPKHRMQRLQAFRHLIERSASFADLFRIWPLAQNMMGHLDTTRFVSALQGALLGAGSGFSPVVAKSLVAGSHSRRLSLDLPPVGTFPICVMQRERQTIAFNRELQAARAAESSGNHDAARRCLELAHIVGQDRLLLHWRSHCAMLGLALRTGRPAEAFAQVGRLFLTPLGHLSGRLPQFNPGSGRVGAFEPMPWPLELDLETLERFP